MHASTSRRPGNTAHRLRRSLAALSVVATVASVAASLVLFAARPLTTPVMAGLPQGPAVALAPLVAEAVNTSAPTLEAGSADARTTRKNTRRSRQTLAMPYFSFARN